MNIEQSERHLPWFRFFVDTIDDPMLSTLSPMLFKFWIGCLCAAGRYDGKLPPVDKLAFHLRCSIDEAQASTRALIAAGVLIERDGALAPHDWTQRRHASDSSRQRTRDYRARQKIGDGHSDGHRDTQTRPEKKRKEKTPATPGVLV